MQPYDDDDDSGPPPLSSLADQVHALSIEQASIRRPAIDEGGDGDLPIASTTVAGQKLQATSGHAKEEPKAIKRGFFDAKPAKKSSAAPSRPQIGESSKPVIEELKGRKGGQQGPIIPDFLRVEPDAEGAKRIEEFKGKLVEALKPTPEVISSIGKDPRLMAGFEDPEVMAAIDEIGKNPQVAMKKYKDNKKVQEFYMAMAAVMGNKLEKMENKPL